jgi:hypothetical protein
MITTKYCNGLCHEAQTTNLTPRYNVFLQNLTLTWTVKKIPVCKEPGR